MGLLDRILTTDSNTSTPYAEGGRHLVRLTRAYLRDPAEDPSVPKAAGGFDGLVIWSSRNDAKHAKDQTIRVNDTFRFPDSALPRMRRGAAACLSAKTGKMVGDKTFGLTKTDGESDESFNKRVSAEIRRLFGPTQPLKGAMVMFVCTEHINQQGKKDAAGNPAKYTLFEIEVPSEDDLRAAGLIPAAPKAG